MTLTFPLTLWDTSLLLAVTALVLLVTSELISPYYGRINLRISKKRLKNVALTTSIVFLATVAIRIVALLLNV